MATRLTTALSAAVKSKAAVAILTTVVAAGTLGGGTAAAAANGAFGQEVKAKVESCKDALAKGTHGIGECVSDFAQQHSQGHPASNPNDTHGKSQDTHGSSGQHGAPPSATPGSSHGNGNGKP